MGTEWYQQAARARDSRRDKNPNNPPASTHTDTTMTGGDVTALLAMFVQTSRLCSGWVSRWVWGMGVWSGECGVI